MKNLELSQVQDLVYSIFEEFDRICRENDIAYSMEGGTLMGAAKYGDFVPWDDDIDVIMTRDQYERFLKIAPAALDEKFFLQSFNTVKEFPLNYAKLCLNGTMIYDYSYSRLDMHHGVFIDIFPIDNIVPRFWKLHCSLVGVLIGARVTKLKFSPKVGRVKKLIYKTLSLLPMSVLIALVNKTCQLFNRRDTGYKYEVCNPNHRFAPMPSSLYTKHTELPFRGKSFMAVKEYDAFLKSRFGEKYMEELPAEELRKPSHCTNIKEI